MRQRFILAAFASSMLVGGCVYADNDRRHDDDHYDDRYHDGRGDTSVSFHLTFNDRERLHLNDYYRRNLPPGLAMQGKVPPGHAKHYRYTRGMPWPPREPYYSLPQHLERDLRPLPRGYARFVIGPDVVIVDLDARIIVDAFRLDL